MGVSVGFESLWSCGSQSGNCSRCASRKFNPCPPALSHWICFAKNFSSGVPAKFFCRSGHRLRRAAPNESSRYVLSPATANATLSMGFFTRRQRTQHSRKTHANTCAPLPDISEKSVSRSTTEFARKNRVLANQHLRRNYLSSKNINMIDRHALKPKLALRLLYPP